MDADRRINALQQYMDFYRKNNPGYESYNDRSSPMYRPHNYNDDAMRFAMSQMAQSDAPDFFGTPTPSYNAPSYTSGQSVQSIASNAGFPLAMQDRPEVMQRPESTQTGMAINYLRNLFRR